jgi:hypothetical protein
MPTVPPDVAQPPVALLASPPAVELLSAPVPTAAVEMSLHDRIARRAYELYEERGRTPGLDAADWYAAERELQAGHPPTD